MEAEKGESLYSSVFLVSPFSFLMAPRLGLELSMFRMDLPSQLILSEKKALLETSTAPTFQVILEPVKLTAQILAADPETPGIMSSSYPEAFLQCPD